MCWVHKWVYTGSERPAVHIAPLPLASFHLWSAMLYPQHPLGNVVLKRMKKEETNRVVLIICITSISAAMHKAYWLDRHWWYLDHIGPLLVRPDDTGLPMPFDITHTSTHTHTHTHRIWRSFFFLKHVFISDLAFQPSLSRVVPCICHVIHLASFKPVAVLGAVCRMAQ